MVRKVKDIFKGTFNNYQGLPSSIYILFVARIINRFGGFVHAFLSLFLSMYLGMTNSEIGQYVMMAGFAGLAGSLIGGALGDRFSKKIVYLTAQSLAAIMFLPCAYFAMTGDYYYIPELLIISSFFGAVVRPVNTAMVTDIVDKEDRKRAYSLLYLGINIGVAVGPIVAAYLLTDYLVWFFLGDAITTFIAVFLVANYVKEVKVTREQMERVGPDDSEAVEHDNIIIAFFKRPLLMAFVGFSIITSMMYAQISFAFPLLLKDLFGENNGPDVYARLTMLNAVVVIVFTSFVHYLTGKIKPIYNIATAAFLYAIGLGMMAFIDKGWLFAVSILIWTIGEIQAVTNQNVFLMGHTPINYRSRFLAIISFITSLGYIVSPRIGGYILDHYDQQTLWSIVFIGGLIATAGFVFLGSIDKSNHDTSL